MPKARITKHQVHTAFQIYPSHAYALVARGVLPNDPRGIVSTGYIIALADHIKAHRGSIPPDGTALVEAVKGGDDGQ